MGLIWIRLVKIVFSCGVVFPRSDYKLKWFESDTNSDFCCLNKTWNMIQWFCSLITSNPEWWKNQLNWDLIWPFGHVDVVWIRFVNIAFRVCLLVFFTHSHYEYLNGFEYDTKSDFCCLSEQILKCWFITFRDTPCDAFDNVQVHTTVCNQALSMKAFYLSLL